MTALVTNELTRSAVVWPTFWSPQSNLSRSVMPVSVMLVSSSRATGQSTFDASFFQGLAPKPDFLQNGPEGEVAAAVLEVALEQVPEELLFEAAEALLLVPDDVVEVLGARLVHDRHERVHVLRGPFADLLDELLIVRVVLRNELLHDALEVAEGRVVEVVVVLGGDAEERAELGVVVDELGGDLVGAAGEDHVGEEGVVEAPVFGELLRVRQHAQEPDHFVDVRFLFDVVDEALVLVGQLVEEGRHQEQFFERGLFVDLALQEVAFHVEAIVSEKFHLN